MADITAELEEILEAIRGEDVRQSIYRGLLKMNNQVVSNDTLVDALNEAITAETGTNVRSFVERVETALYYKDGDTVTFSDCADSFYMIPGTADSDDSLSTETVRLDFTVSLPKPIKPSANGYTLQVHNLELGGNYRVTASSALMTKFGDYCPRLTTVIGNDNRFQGVIAFAATIGGGNKLHISINIDPAEFRLGEDLKSIVFFNIANLDFTITENSST